MFRNVLKRLKRSGRTPRVAVFNDTRPTRHIGCALVMSELIAHLERVGIEPVWFHPVREDWHEVVDQIPSRGEIDAIIVNGEGSIHRPASRPRARYLPQLGPFAATKLGVPAFLVNSTLYEIDEESAADLATFERIYVRETDSLNVLKRFGLAGAVVPDLTVQAEMAQEGERKGICATDSVLVEPNRIIKAMCQSRGYALKNMVRIPKEQVFDTDQSAAHVKSFCDWLSSHELVVTGRFHTVTLCIATGTPFVAIDSNTPKITSFTRDVFGQSARVVDPNKLADLDMAQFVGWRKDEAAQVTDAQRRAKEVTLKAFREIRERVESSLSGH